MNAIVNFFSFRGLSIRQRLPLLICALLLTIIVAFGFAAYYGIKKAEMTMGSERLASVTNELSAMLSQSTNGFVKQSNGIAENDTIKSVLASSDTTLRDDALLKLKATRKDSTATLVEIVDSSFNPILSYSEDDSSTIKPLLQIQGSFATVSSLHRNIVGNIYSVNNRLYSFAVAPIAEKQKLIGYLV